MIITTPIPLFLKIGIFFFLSLSCLLTSSNVFATDYYISPTGNDSDSGLTQSTPFKTFARAINAPLSTPHYVRAGDTLWVMDGIYYDAIHPSRRSGLPNAAFSTLIDTNSNTYDDRDEPENSAFIPYDDPGRTANYIKIKALHDGQATIDGEFVRTPIILGVCDSNFPCQTDVGESKPGNYFSIEGLIARNGFTTTVTTLGHHNIFKRISSYNTDSRKNNHGISAGTGSVHNLFEDCISAGSNRKSVFAYASHYSIFRRIFTYWQEWDGRLQMGTEWPWGNAAEFYNSSSGIIENVMAIGTYPEVAFGILSNMANSASPRGASDNQILGSAVINNGMYADDTPWRWGMARALEPPDIAGPLKRYWEWPGQRIGINLHTWGSNAVVNNNLVKDIFVLGGMGLGLQTSYDADDTFLNNQVDHVTLLDNKQDTTFSDSIDGAKGTDMITERVSALSITNSRISRVCTEATKTSPTGCTSQTGEGARLANRYINGVLTDNPLWPWPMQDRIIKEVGYDITGTMTDIFIDNNTPTGNAIKAPLISPVPPIGSPLKNIPGTTYLSPVTISLTMPAGATSIHYTLNGTPPTSASPLYTAPFSLTTTTLVKAIAFSSSGTTSHLRSTYYRIEPGTTNQPPEVIAADGLFVSSYVEIVLPKNSINLHGVVEDFTLPQGSDQITSTWEKVSGPGTVTFGNASLPRTTATFSSAGLYGLRLTATDNSLSTSKDIEVRVWPADLQGISHSIPGRIEAENYLSTVEGVGHHQVINNDSDSVYRIGSRVATRYTYNNTASYSIHNLYAGEWLAYRVNVTQTAPYLLNLRYATANSMANGGRIHFELDDTDVSGPITLNFVANSYLGYQTISNVNVGTLSAGEHILKIVADQAPAGVIPPVPTPTPTEQPMLIAINYFEFTSTVPTSPSITPFAGFDGDIDVDWLDLNILLSHFNQFTAQYSLLGTGWVDIFDFNKLIQLL